MHGEITPCARVRGQPWAAVVLLTPHAPGQEWAPAASPEIGQPWAADGLPSHRGQVGTHCLAGRQERCLWLGMMLSSAGHGMCCPSCERPEPSCSVSAAQSVRIFSVPTNHNIIKMY